MTYEEFKKAYLGKQVEYHSFDPKAKFQCVDLANRFIIDVLGLTPLIGTNAKDFPAKIDKTQFEVLVNTSDFIPKFQDIAIWDGDVGGGAGHISVVCDNKATAQTFNSIDQNWSKPLHVTLETHNYNNVSHFLRAKGQPMPDNTMIITKADFEKIRGNSEKWDQTVAQLELGTDPATTPFEAAQRVIAGLKSRQTDLQNQLTTANVAKTNAEDQVSRLKTQLTDEQKLHLDAFTNEKKRADLAIVAQGQAEARSKVLQGQVDEASKAKGEALEQAATAKVDAQNWKDKYEQLLANKAKTLSFRDRLLILLTGKI